MTPALLHGLVEIDNWARAEAERNGGSGPPKVSTNPASDLLSLASM